MPRVDDIRLRHGTAAQWASANPVLNLGEPGLETDTTKTKFGDGSTAWNALPYSAGASSGGGGSTGPVSVAYSAAIPLDTTGDGKIMPQTTLSTNQVFGVAPGAVEGGSCQLCLVGDGSHSPDLSAFTSANGYTYVNTANARNLLIFGQQYGSAIFAGVQLSAVGTGAPTLLSATVSDSDATTINLLWSAPMNALVSGAAAFTIAGHTITAHARVDATNTKLTTSVPIIQTESLSVVYAVPGSNPMQDLSNNQALAFSHGITNNVTNPQISSAIVSNSTPTRIDLTWSDTISSTIPAASAFAISAGHALTAHTYVDSTHTYLTTSAVFTAGETARTLTYTVPGSNPIKDLAVLPNLGLAITGKAITNNVVGGATLTQTSQSLGAMNLTTALRDYHWFRRTNGNDLVKIGTAIDTPAITYTNVGFGISPSVGAILTVNDSDAQVASGGGVITPAFTGTGTDVQMYFQNAVGAWKISVPLVANIAQQTVRVLFGGQRQDTFSAPGICKLTATLSDGSAGPLTITTATPSADNVGVLERHDITFSAATNGVTLTLKFEAAAGSTFGDILLLQLVGLV